MQAYALVLRKMDTEFFYVLDNFRFKHRYINIKHYEQQILDFFYNTCTNLLNDAGHIFNNS